MAGLSHYLAVSGLLFCIGLLGVVLRRNLLVIYMCVELMLAGANLALVAFSRFKGNLDGQLLALFVMCVAAAEAAVGLALVVMLCRQGLRPAVDEVTKLKL
ncbi:MAG: NADH-quinone oxidoreductase subunit NuoK [Verrucomicrobiae bacterium]|nr:NADH-quinone oxidoreductase subunit NuoK [Verrucomicrobiae bacterium]